MVDTNFTSVGTENEVFLGKGLTMNHFLRCMYYLIFPISDWLGQGRKCIDPSTPKYAPAPKIDPPITMPVKSWVEGAIPEPIYMAPYDFYVQNLSWPGYNIREGFAVSETSHQYGQYVGQREAARRSLRELMGALYAIRHSVLNLKSDLERMDEQVKAFKADNEELVKGIFVDNYGGQGRTFTEIARNAPIVKTALSWFYKISTKDMDDANKQIEAVVSSNELNPVVANFLKRKFQEYFTWKDEYKTWLFNTHDRMLDLIAEQESNEKIYEAWAKDNLISAKRLELDWDMVKDGISDIEIPRFVAKIGYYVEQFYYMGGAQVAQLMEPWVPCFACCIGIFYNPELQGWKFTRSWFQFYWGSIHRKDLKILESWRDLDIKQTDLTKMLAMRAGVGFGDVEKQMKELEAKKAVEKKKEPEKPKSSEVEDVLAGEIGQTRQWWDDSVKTFSDTVLKPFGVDVIDKANIKRMRADAASQQWFNAFYNGFRSNFGIPVL